MHLALILGFLLGILLERGGGVKAGRENPLGDHLTFDTRSLALVEVGLIFNQKQLDF